MRSMFKKLLMLLFVLFVMGGVLIGTASATLVGGQGLLVDIDYNFIDVDPATDSDHFIVNGSSVTLQTDETYWGVSLFTEIIVPEAATTISFDYGESFFLVGQAFLGGINLLDTFDVVDNRYTTGISGRTGNLLELAVFDYFEDDPFFESITFGNISYNAPVPEPGTLLLLSMGLAGLGLYGYRRKQTE